MPVVHKSTIRRARQAEKRQARNRAALSAVKSLVKKVQTAVADKKIDEARASLHIATSALSKAVSKGVETQYRLPPHLQTHPARQFFGCLALIVRTFDNDLVRGVTAPV
jgi:small subunit ribosomal protein S20